MYFTDVILPIPLEKLFTYAITEAESSFLIPGMRVAVPFGKQKIYTAIVHKVHQNAPHAYTAKSIHQILDKAPVVTLNQLKLWSWISKYYLSTLGEVLRAAMPSSFLLESETIISLNKQKIFDTPTHHNLFLPFLMCHSCDPTSNVSLLLRKEKKIKKYKLYIKVYIKVFKTQVEFIHPNTLEKVSKTFVDKNI